MVLAGESVEASKKKEDEKIFFFSSFSRRDGEENSAGLAEQWKGGRGPGDPREAEATPMMERIDCFQSEVSWKTSADDRNEEEEKQGMAGEVSLDKLSVRHSSPGQGAEEGKKKKKNCNMGMSGSAPKAFPESPSSFSAVSNDCLCGEESPCGILAIGESKTPPLTREMVSSLDSGGRLRPLHPLDLLHLHRRPDSDGEEEEENTDDDGKKRKKAFAFAGLSSGGTSTTGSSSSSSDSSLLSAEGLGRGGAPGLACSSSSSECHGQGQRLLHAHCLSPPFSSASSDHVEDEEAPRAGEDAGLKEVSGCPCSEREDGRKEEEEEEEKEKKREISSWGPQRDDKKKKKVFVSAEETARRRADETKKEEEEVNELSPSVLREEEEKLTKKTKEEETFCLNPTRLVSRRLEEDDDEVACTRHLVFVYGTLKRGMPNHHVFVQIAEEVEEAEKKERRRKEEGEKKEEGERDEEQAREGGGKQKKKTTNEDAVNFSSFSSSCRDRQRRKLEEDRRSAVALFSSGSCGEGNVSKLFSSRREGKDFLIVTHSPAERADPKDERAKAAAGSDDAKEEGSGGDREVGERRTLFHPSLFFGFSSCEVGGGSEEGSARLDHYHLRVRRSSLHGEAGLANTAEEKTLKEKTRNEKRAADTHRRKEEKEAKKEEGDAQEEEEDVEKVGGGGGGGHHHQNDTKDGRRPFSSFSSSLSSCVTTAGSSTSSLLSGRVASSLSTSLGDGESKPSEAEEDEGKREKRTEKNKREEEEEEVVIGEGEEEEDVAAPSASLGESLSSEETPVAVYLFDAITSDPYPLFIDASQRNRPCLLNARGFGERVKGEIYAVSTSVLQALDKFERVPDHYRRHLLHLQVVKETAPPGSVPPGEVYAHVYFNVHSDHMERLKKEDPILHQRVLKAEEDALLEAREEEEEKEGAEQREEEEGAEQRRLRREEKKKKMGEEEKTTTKREEGRESLPAVSVEEEEESENFAGASLQEKRLEEKEEKQKKSATLNRNQMDKFSETRKGTEGSQETQQKMEEAKRTTVEKNSTSVLPSSSPSSKFSRSVSTPCFRCINNYDHSHAKLYVSRFQKSSFSSSSLSASPPSSSFSRQQQTSSSPCLLPSAKVCPSRTRT